MNRNLVSSLALVSMLALLGGCNEEAKPQKPAPQFGVVQVAKIYQESQLGKQGIARVGELEDKAMAVLGDVQAKLEKAIQIAKLSRVIRVAFQVFKKEGGEEDV